MAFIHGKKTAVFLGEYDFSPVATEVSISASANPVDVTTFADAGAANLKAYGQGLSEGTFSISGMWATADLDPDDGGHRATIGSADKILGDWEAAGSTIPVALAKSTVANTLFPNGIQILDLTPVTMISGLIQSWNVTSPVDGVVALDAELLGNATSATATTSNKVGGTPKYGVSICHSYVDDTLTDTASSPFTWNGADDTVKKSSVVEVGTDAHDFGALVQIHVLDNTLDVACSIEAHHGTSGTVADWGADFWPTGAGALAARSIGSKAVAYNPGVGGTDGHWAISITPETTPTAGGEISIFAAVSIFAVALL